MFGQLSGHAGLVKYFRSRSISIVRPLIRLCLVPTIQLTSFLSTGSATIMSSSKQVVQGCSKHIKTEEKSRMKWIALNSITYEDPLGKTRQWEGVSRTTRHGTEADAVGIITVFRDPVQKCDCVVLVRQYRPPLETYTVEFPAGLIDAGETAAQAAEREMREETGFIVKAKFVSPVTSLDPGIANTTLKLVTCEMAMDDIGSAKPEPTDPDEFTEVIVQPLSTMLSKLEEFSNAQDVVDSRVYTWAMARCANL